ncbi:glycosyltransferase family 1 protein [Alicyclobacillaceae bacterium I2511]|nr:glycosyltransferase family 1 protein [Alicyclobacillaceae bacterium I2511]
MKVVLIAPEDLPIPPTRGGSVQIYLQALYELLKNHPGIVAHLISPGNKSRVVLHSPQGLQNHPHTLPLPPAQTYRHSLLYLLQSIHPDVVQIENRPNLVMSIAHQLPTVPVVLNLHSMTFLGPRHIPPKLARQVLRSADAVVFNSHYLAHTVAHHFNLSTPLENGHVIYPGVDLERFTPRIAPLPPPPPLRLIYVGRIIPQKGVHVLLTALHQLKLQGQSIHLTMVGKTPPWERAYGMTIERLGKGLHINRLGFLPPRVLPAHLWEHHALVCPSQYKEAFGLVNVEAMAAGLPVIASRIGGIPEIVDESCGQLVTTPQSPHNWVRALNHWLEHPQTYLQACTGAKKRVQKFPWEQTARQFAILYETLLQSVQNSR